MAGDEDQNGLFASAVVDKGTGEYIVKVANTSDSDQSLAVRFNGLDGITSARQILLHSDDLDADNTLDEPEKIVPEETSISANGDVLNVTLKAKTFAVYIVKK